MYPAACENPSVVVPNSVNNVSCVPALHGTSCNVDCSPGYSGTVTVDCVLGSFQNVTGECTGALLLWLCGLRVRLGWVGLAHDENRVLLKHKTVLI